MVLNEMEKRQLFQVEGDSQTKVLNELYHTARYTTDPEQRKSSCMGAATGWFPVRTSRAYA